MCVCGLGSLSVWMRVNMGVCAGRGGGVTELCRALGGQFVRGDAIPRRLILYDGANV